MVVNFDVQFDNNPHGTYFAGQMLTGSVTMTANKAKTVKAVALNIRGFAHVYWNKSETETVGGERKSTTNQYHGHEDYIASTTFLLGSNIETSSVTIAPGVHTFNFACHIPPKCPSSFEGIYGHIRYLVKVVLMRPSKFDQSYTRGFTVLKILDLNFNSPLLRAPSNQEVQKTFCCGPCRSEPLQIHINLPQTGYVPGQMIPVSVLITNDSRVPITELKIRLVMLVCYYSQIPCTLTQQQRTVIGKIKGDPVMGHCKKLSLYNLVVPPTPPSSFVDCSIIQIAYEVQVEAIVKGMHKNQVVRMPITIGNVPLGGAVSQQPRMGLVQRREIDCAASGEEQEPSTSDQVDAANEEHESNEARMRELPIMTSIASASETSPWSMNANIAPPSYEEAQHVPSAKINDGDEHDYGQCDFTPRYPVFNIPSPTAPTVEELENGFANGNRNSSKGTWL